MVTLNGRQMPAANVQNVGTNSFNARGDSRSFDFSVLASEGVTGLQVYKTGRASAPTGGIGATINVNTARPLEVGTQFAIGGKLVDDAGSAKGDLTPELSGLASWTNDDETIGVSLFASYQERDSSVRSGTFGGNVWINPPGGIGYDPDNGAVVNAVHVNEPAVGDLAGYPSNTRIEYATTHRERTNAMLTLEFAPSDRLGITLDAMYTINDLDHNSIQDQQWWARQYDNITWDGNPVVSSPTIMSETYAEVASFTQPGTDILHDNRWIRQRDEMTSLGLNFDYAFSDDLTFNVDLASSESKSSGRWPGGYALYRGVIAGAVSGWRASDMSADVPATLIAITDGQGDQDGIYEVGDVGSQQTRRSWNDQTAKVDQIQLSGSWDNGGSITVDFGVGRLETEMDQFWHEEGNQLGGWGVSDTGDIERLAPGLVQRECTICEFRDFDFDVSPLVGLAPAGASLITLGEVSMRVDPFEYFYAMDGWQSLTTGSSFVYDAQNPSARGKDENIITEDVTSVYLSTTMEGQIGDKPMQLVAGIRYETTDVLSATRQSVPLAIVWTSDNDSITEYGSEESVVSEKHDYDNLLPSLDFSVDLTDELKLRASFSKTIARPQYSFMFVPTGVGDGSTLTYLGGIPVADKGTAQLDPLESDNFDLSVEYYYGESNYASVGYFQKLVSNFVGIETVPQSLFGLRDSTGRSPGNRLDQAIDALEAYNGGAGFPATEESLFTMTALVAHPGGIPGLNAGDPNRYVGGASAFDGTPEQALAVFNALDVTPDSSDPLFIFNTSQPVNNNVARIDGFEIAWQHFFGDSGFGIIANATLVGGDIKFDNAAPPTFDQFALEGLSDSANAILVWENDTFGARIAYNWRDTFLSSTNAGNFIPQYYDEHAQLDVNFSWNVSDQLSLSLDGINLTEEGVITRGRTPNMTDWGKEYDTRWTLAARYNFR